MDDVDKAKALASSQELKDRMKKASNRSTRFDYLTLVLNDTTAIDKR